jgi:hypothetical protein
MAGNATPIFSRVGVINSIVGPLTTAANDYTGTSPFNQQVFKSDSTNGGFVQRIRFKALGTNVATVARVFLNPGNVGHLASLATAPGTPSGTPSTSGGTLIAGTTYYAKIVGVDANGCMTALSAESSAVTTTGATGSIAWTWTASNAATSYRIYVASTATGAESGYFTSSTNSFTQIAMPEGSGFTDGQPITSNNIFYGEISLPATTLSATAATVDVDYPMNIAIPPGWEIYVGLGTTVAAGWVATIIGGAY